MSTLTSTSVDSGSAKVVEQEQKSSSFVQLFVGTRGGKQGTCQASEVMEAKASVANGCVGCSLQTPSLELSLLGGG